MRRPFALGIVAGVLVLAGPALALRLDGTIATVAGTGIAGRTGDGGPAVAAEIGHPRGIAVAADGGYAFAEPFNATIRRIAADGTVTSVAGTGVAGYAGDGGPASTAELNLPHGVALTTSGGLLIADTLNQRIRLVSPDGSISTVVGNGSAGFAGDGGPASAAQVDTPRGIAALADGGFLIADTGNQRIRRVFADGTITTVAGSGVRGFSGDGGLATAAGLANPFGVTPVRDGGLLVADTGNDRVRRVAPDGTITTVAGSDTRGFGGDDGPATAAALNQPHAVAVLPDGGFLVADTVNNRVRRVWPDGRITTVAGTGTPGSSGDGGEAADAELNQPKAVAVMPGGQGFLVGDSANNRVRLVSLDLRTPLSVRVIGPPLRARTGTSAVVRYTLSLPATVWLEVRRRERLVLRVRASGVAGANALRFGRRLRPGVYRLMLTAMPGDGRRSSAGSSLRVTA